MTKKIFLLSITLLLSGFSSILYSQQTDAKLKHLTINSDLIVTGKVFKQQSNWNKDKSRIFTEATIQVDEFLKGSSNGNSVVVTYPGGEIDGVGELYTHMPKFADNEDVLVFLKKDDSIKGFKVFDGQEGEIKILKDAKTGEKVTSSNVQISSIKEQIRSYLNK